MKTIEWSGGGSPVRQFHYRLVVHDDHTSELYVRQDGLPGDAYTLVETGHHSIARKLAVLFLEDERDRWMSIRKVG